MPVLPPGAAGRRRGGRARSSAAPGTGGRQPVRVSRRSRTSPACSTRSSGSRRAQRAGWDVLLDAAAFVPTNRLDLAPLAARLRRPVVLQDVRLPDRRRRAARAPAGAREAPAAVVRRRHDHASPRCRADRYHPADGAAAFEDGTLNFTCLPAVEHRPRLHRAGRPRRDPRPRRAPDRLAARRARCALRHSNGRRWCASTDPTTSDRAAARSRSTSTTAGGAHRPPLIEERRRRARHLAPHGLLLQPGRGRDRARHFGRRDARRASRGSRDRLTYDDFRRCIDGKSTRRRPGLARHGVDLRRREHVRRFRAVVPGLTGHSQTGRRQTGRLPGQHGLEVPHGIPHHRESPSWHVRHAPTREDPPLLLDRERPDVVSRRDHARAGCRGTESTRPPAGRPGEARQRPA